MARPNKQTLDYFQHDADASNKKTIRILYNHFQHEGISLWWQLLENISVNRNLVIDCKNYDIVEDLAAKMHFSPERLTEMINKLAELDAIDKQLWQQEKVIWCQNLVDRHQDVFKRWANGSPQKPQLMLAETSKNDTKTPQIKRKEKKEKDTKLYGQFQNVKLTDDEYQKLQDKFNSQTEIMIENLSEYIASKGKKYSNHYATILSWSRKDNKEVTNEKRYTLPHELD